MTQEQFEFTANVVRAVLDPWLNLHFGKRCAEYEYGCENCRRWKLADELLEWYGNDRKRESLEQEIATLKECVRWREELLAELQKGDATSQTAVATRGS